MLMGLTAPLQAGQEVSLTLTFADQSTVEVSAPVKDFAGADETYQSGEDSGSEMDPSEASASDG